MKFFRVIAYVLTFVILLYMSVFFNSYYILVATAGLLFAGVVDVVLFFIPFGIIDVDIISNKTDYVKGEKGEIYLRLKSKKLFPVYNAKIDVVFKNKFYEADKINIRTPLPVLMVKTIVIPLNIERAGIIDISVKNIEYSDMFGIFKKIIKADKAYSVIVMPVGTDIDMTYFGYAESDEIPSTNVYLSSNGDISGYKEYGAGDRTNNINWKLFAGTNKLYVREFERTSADEAVVLMDMNIKNLDNALDILYSIGYKNGGFTLLWLPLGNEEFESAYISDKDSLNNAIYRIYNSAPSAVENNGLIEYKRLYRENKVLYISDKMELL